MDKPRGAGHRKTDGITPTSQQDPSRRDDLPPISRAAIRRMRASLRQILNGRPASALSGEQFEKAVEEAHGCELPEGLRVRGFHDRWNARQRVGYACKTVLIKDRRLGEAVWEQNDGPIPLVEIEWGRVNLPVTTLCRYWSTDRPDLLGRELIRRLVANVERSAERRDIDTSVWAIGLRHSDGRRFAYAELPFVAPDAKRLRWSWITVREDGEDDPIVLEGEDLQRGWIIRWFLRGGQVHVRIELDRNHLTTFTI